MDTEQDLTLIDNYIQGTLTNEERDAVAARITSDSSFQELYQFTLSVKQATQRFESARIKQMLRQVKIEDKPFQPEGVLEPEGFTGAAMMPPPPEREPKTIPFENRSTSRWPIASMGIAASTLFALLIWQPTRSSNEEVFAAYAASTTRPMAPEADPASRSAEPGTRGSEVILKGLTASESEQALRALELIQVKDFEPAKAIFQQLIKARGEQPVLLYNLAIAELNSNEVEPAIDKLEKLKRLPDLPFKEDISYTLALAYIKSGELGKARTLLKSLRATSSENAFEATNSKYAASAEKILSELRWWF